MVLGRGSGLWRCLPALALAASLSGCTAPDGLTARPATATAPAHRAPVPPEIAAPPSAASSAARGYYARIETHLRESGQLRTDGGGPDTPFSAGQLAENFVRIALYDEYVTLGGNLVRQEVASHLRRWEQPVRMTIGFGASVPLSQRIRDRGDLAAYGQRLSRLTGLGITLDPGRPNLTVLVLNEDERKASAARLREAVPAIDQAAVRAITQMDPSTYCIAFDFSHRTSSVYSQALIVIRGELPDLLRLSCLHEELAQSLGLANDSPRARPSIFNDDGEFALLTRQDELMLKMLYDRRLKPGMTATEAQPIVETIALELTGGAS